MPPAGSGDPRRARLALAPSAAAASACTIARHRLLSAGRLGRHCRFCGRARPFPSRSDKTNNAGNAAAIEKMRTPAENAAVAASAVPRYHPSFKFPRRNRPSPRTSVTHLPSGTTPPFAVRMALRGAGPCPAHASAGLNRATMSYALITLWHERQRFLPGVLAVAFSALLVALAVRPPPGHLHLCFAAGGSRAGGDLARRPQCAERRSRSGDSRNLHGMPGRAARDCPVRGLRAGRRQLGPRRRRRRAVHDRGHAPRGLLAGRHA